MLKMLTKPTNLALLIAATLMSSALTYASIPGAPAHLGAGKSKHHGKAARPLDVRLAHATEHGDLREMRALLDSGADPNFKRTNTFRYPLLLVAAINGHPDAVALLLERGADPEAKDLRGTPIIVSAASVIMPDSPSDRVEAVRMLLEKGRANPNAKDTARIGDDRTALHMASANGSVELATLLLEHGANPNQVNRFRETPLYFAAERGNVSVARTLLSHGANPNARTRFTRMTPLLAAAQTGQSHVVRLLIEMRADLSVRDAFGENPAALAASAAHHASTDAERQRCQETLALLRQASLRVSLSGEHWARVAANRF